MTRTEFLTIYPEFDEAPVSLIDAKLAETSVLIDPNVWGVMTEQAHGLLTAHRLATAPNGQFARLVSKEGKTTYGAEFESLQPVAAVALRVF